MSTGSLGQRIKDPQDVLDYPIDWSLVLAPGETIIDANWSVPSGLTKGSTSIATPVTTCWISGGTVGTRYEVDCMIVTNQGRTFDRSFELRVEQK